jgi:hypothetical protein
MTTPRPTSSKWVGFDQSLGQAGDVSEGALK